MDKETFNTRVAMPNMPIDHRLMAAVYNIIKAPSPASTGDKPEIQPSFNAFPGHKRPIVNPKGSQNVGRQ
jgi:hypothetical protein